MVFRDGDFGKHPFDALRQPITPAPRPRSKFADMSDAEFNSYVDKLQNFDNVDGDRDKVKDFVTSLVLAGIPVAIAVLYAFQGMR